MGRDPRTKQYVERQVTAGKTTSEFFRMLRWAIAREIHRLLTQNIPVPDYADLRPARQAKNISFTAAANAFSHRADNHFRIERGLQRNDDLATRYRTWLQAA